VGDDAKQTEAGTRHGIVEAMVALPKRSPPRRIRITPTAA
jgi:hypothetical protein